MKTTTTRTATAAERARLEALLQPAPRGSRGRLLGLFMGVPVGITALAVLNLALPAPAFLRAALAVAIGAWAVSLFGRWAEARHAEMLRPAKEAVEALEADLAAGRVAVTRYDADEAVKVQADPGRLVGTSWFLRLAGGPVVLLVGSHLEEAVEAGEFPAASFEIAAGETSHFVLSVRKTGAALEPVAVRAPLSDAEWEAVGDDVDETVPLSWPEVLESARRNPPSGAARPE